MLNTNFKLDRGAILISEPFLKDDNFQRAVIVIAEHSEEGTFGFIINKVLNVKVAELLPDLISFNFPVHLGGPVAEDTMYYIHDFPPDSLDSIDIGDSIKYGGNFDKLQKFVEQGKHKKGILNFYIGYSGWSAGQLQKEIDEKTWFVLNHNLSELFALPKENMWAQCVKWLGADWEEVANYPIDPNLN